MADLTTFQESVQSIGVDAWVLYDFRGTNSLAHSILGVPSDAHCTRRWMVVIPAHGTPIKVMHKMERDHLSHLQWTDQLYSTHSEWTNVVKEALAPYHTLAMEYSPNNSIPVVSKVDAGTIEMIRGLGHVVVSSGNIAQQFTSVLTNEQIDEAVTAGQTLRSIIIAAFTLIRDSLKGGKTITEYAVQQFILQSFEANNMETDSVPIVAIGVNAAMPHYAPSSSRSSDITDDMVVLIDSWAKYRKPGAVFADLTWVGYTSDIVPSNVADMFDVIVRARDAAVSIVRDRFDSKQPICGYEVDDACRRVVADAKLGEYFIHRTGHNITTEIHGPGVNMDDFETHDERLILPGMCFSVEPGVYKQGMIGLRTEIDVIVHHDGTINIPSEPIQRHIIPLLAQDWMSQCC